MTLGKFKDDLIKGPGSPSLRRIRAGDTLIAEWDGADKGYIQGAIYHGNYPLIARWDGMPGNQKDVETNTLDIVDGKIEIPTFHKFSSNGPRINFPPDVYTLHIEASDDNKAMPSFKNIQFDIVP